MLAAAETSRPAVGSSAKSASGRSASALAIEIAPRLPARKLVRVLVGLLGGQPDHREEIVARSSDPPAAPC